jgi:MFS family permease
MMDNLGAIGGPILALLLVAVFSVRTASLLSIIPGLLATLAILYAIHRLAKVESRERQPIRLQVKPVLRAGLGRLMLGVSAFELGNVAATLLILRATELLDLAGGRTLRRLPLWSCTSPTTPPRPWRAFRRVTPPTGPHLDWC